MGNIPFKKIKYPLFFLFIMLVSLIFFSGCTTSEISTSRMPLQRPNAPVVDLSHVCFLMDSGPRCMVGAPTLEPSEVTLYSNGEMWINPHYWGMEGYEDITIIYTMCDFYKWYTKVRPTQDIIPISSIVIEKASPNKIDVRGNSIPQSPEIQVKLFLKNIDRADWCNLINYPDYTEAIHANFDFIYGI